MGSGLVAQDERDTWTDHDFLTPGNDGLALTHEETVYRVIGGMGQPFKIDIDEILVESTYRPTIAAAKTYSGPHRRLFLAGDSAHQIILSGGYDMNMGLADAFLG